MIFACWGGVFGSISLVISCKGLETWGVANLRVFRVEKIEGNAFWAQILTLSGNH